MKQMLVPMESMGALVKQQTYIPGTAYRWSSFALRLPSKEGWILYHTLSGEMLSLTQDELDRFDTEAPLKEALVSKRFLVPEGFDELRYADQIKNVVRLLHKGKNALTGFTIFTTLDCNARCFYCYEKGRPRPAMTDAVAQDVADFILRTSRGEEVKLRWFGGEPLLNTQAIQIITSALRQNGTRFSSTMVSNGYLFDREIVRMAREEWDLKKVQITLDGTEPVYNRTKAFVDTAGSPFQKVLQSIDLLLDAGVSVIVRLNMHRNNVDDLHALAQSLAERFSGRDHFAVYAALLRDSFGSFIGLEQREALDAFRGLNAELRELGLRKPAKLHRKLKPEHCMAANDASVTVLPTGALGKCEHFSESELFGTIYSEQRDEAVISAWKETLDRTEACRTCAYYPLCSIIKKCPNVLNTCTEINRQIRMDELIEQVYAAYRESIEKGEKGEEPNEDQA